MRIPRRGRKGAWAKEPVDGMAVYCKEAPGPFAASLLARHGSGEGRDLDDEDRVPEPAAAHSVS
jgi:hypothetical protein